MIVPEKPARETLVQFHSRLAAMVRRYWKDQGHKVTVQINETTVSGRTVYFLQSDTVNGLPRSFAGPARHLSVVGVRPDPVDSSGIRDCMTCGEPFKSDGIGNRICEKCKSK